MPSIETPTAESVGGDLAHLTTDTDGEPRFYERSLPDAISAGEPFVIVLATPAFCETRTCAALGVVAILVREGLEAWHGGEEDRPASDMEQYGEVITTR